MSRIHPTAIIDPKAQLHESVEVGAYAVIGPCAVIGAHTVIHPFAQVLGHSTLGQHNVVHSHCVIGGPPQDKKYAGEPTRVEIGDGNTLRECCTVNLGTVQDKGVTRIGDDNWIMAYVHIAHDCHVGSHTIMANATQLGGHAQIGDWAILGGITGVHQFVRVGAHAMTGTGTTLTQDLPPYVMSTGNPASAQGLNSVGLKRRGFTDGQMLVLKRAYKILYKSGNLLADAIEQMRSAERFASDGLTPEAEDLAVLAPLIEFLSMTGRGIVR